MTNQKVVKPMFSVSPSFDTPQVVAKAWCLYLECMFDHIFEYDDVWIYNDAVDYDEVEAKKLIGLSHLIESRQTGLPIDDPALTENSHKSQMTESDIRDGLGIAKSGLNIMESDACGRLCNAFSKSNCGRANLDSLKVSLGILQAYLNSNDI